MPHSHNGKVYEGVLHQLKRYIESHQLKPGDKLPSERELSEQLQVGRSSIREAFRAMELLGLIETKRGEGTFMRAYRPYHMVELLSNFLLNETRTRDELVAAKQMLEKEALMRLAGNVSADTLAVIEQICHEFDGEEKHLKLFHYLFEVCGQHLLLSMWQFISGFTQTVHKIEYESSWYQSAIRILKGGKPEDVFALFSTTDNPST
ncbi:GntR family transcriptional regulator [Halobacillus litoralis]|uniref:FadR/GntR family transcriptional regulator n=1 Tax=Halobacillus litoralis TaxID=45668 RepID=UPI001CD1F5B5|nr:GntR family transcriptional regulator [Halobacillus litoralis]MCA0969829.1 GntR family transcriptional regulator [Halobacillus litoralis]